MTSLELRWFGLGSGLLLGLAALGCGGTAVRPGGGGGGGGPKDMVFVFPGGSDDGGGGGGDDGGGGPGGPNSCGDFDPGCQSRKFGPVHNEKFPVRSDKPADPNQSDDGVSRDPNGYLGLDQTKASSEFLFAANSEDWQRGTVSKFSTKTLKEVARFFTVTCNSLKTGSKMGCDGKNGCCAADSGPQFEARKMGLPAAPYQQVNLMANAPSRTAVDFDGSLWVSNRAFSGQSSVTKIAGDVSQCIDRNKNGKIDTSRDANGDGIIQTDCNANGKADDLDDVKAQPCQNGLSEEFFGLDDECVLMTTNTNSKSNQYGRPLGLGPGANDFGPSDAWAGTYNDGKFFRVDGTTGITKDMVQLPGNCRPYGLVVDSSGYGWATNLGSGMCYFNTKNTQQTGVVRQLNSQSGYGIALDRDQNIWVASGNAYRYTPDRSNGFNNLGMGRWTAVTSPGRNNGGGSGLGVGVDSRSVKDYFVFIAGGSSVTQIPASQIPLPPMGQDTTVDGSAYPAVRVSGSAKGVGVAADQNVFCIAQGTAVVTRVKVDANGLMTAPDLASPPMGNTKCPAGDRCEYKDNNATNPSPYTYSDFTGFGLKNFTRPKGSYSYIVEGCRDGNMATDTKWLKVNWDASVALNTQLTARVRSGKTPMPDNTWGNWTQEFKATPAEFEMLLQPNDKEAHYLQVEFQFSTTDKKNTPKLKGFEVVFKCGPGIG